MDIEEGEDIFVVGPSRTGKSILLHYINCLEMADEGEIQIRNRDIG